MTSRTAAQSALIAMFSPLQILMHAAAIVVQWNQRTRTRKDLRSLPDYMLRDIGLDPVAAADEATKPFWRA